MVNEPDTDTLETEIKTLRATLNAALKSITTKQDVDLPLIGDMVEHLTKRLQHEVVSMDPAIRETILIQLTEIVTKFGSLEEAFKANAPFPAGLENEAAN